MHLAKNNYCDRRKSNISRNILILEISSFTVFDVHLGAGTPCILTQSELFIMPAGLDQAHVVH